MTSASVPEFDYLAKVPLAGGWVRSVRSADLGRRLTVWPVPAGVWRDAGTSVVLLWRTRRNRPAAIDARCPHRQFLMADARLVRDAVECPFHGFRYGPDGRCVNVRRAAAARPIAVREAGGYIWLAAGRPPG